MRWKVPEIVVPYPLNCPITAFASKDDELVRPDHVNEWLRLSKGKMKSFFCDTGGYFFFNTVENLEFMQTKISNICRGIVEKEDSDEPMESDNEGTNEHINAENSFDEVDNDDTIYDDFLILRVTSLQLPRGGYTNLTLFEPVRALL